MYRLLPVFLDVPLGEQQTQSVVYMYDRLAQHFNGLGQQYEALRLYSDCMQYVSEKN